MFDPSPARRCASSYQDFQNTIPQFLTILINGTDRSQLFNSNDYLITRTKNVLPVTTLNSSPCPIARDHSVRSASEINESQSEAFLQGRHTARPSHSSWTFLDLYCVDHKLRLSCPDEAAPSERRTPSAHAPTYSNSKQAMLNEATSHNAPFTQFAISKPMRCEFECPNVNSVNSSTK